MRAVLWLSGLGVLLTTPAFAQSRALAEAERAYQSVDFPAAHALAKKALEAGGADREQTARLYVLLAISAAAQGDSEAAKAAFVSALAVDPTLKLDKGLSPKVRDPYLEARGYWGASSERLALSAKPSSDREHLIIQLSDPASLVSKLELRIAEAGVATRPSFQLSATPATRFALPSQLRGRSYEYSLRALDRFGNVLAERGSDADPELVRIAPAAPSKGSTLAPAPHTRSYLLPATLGVAGLGAIAAGVVFQLERESDARAWNSASCEQAGQTRIQQCQGVDDSRERNQHLALGFYAAGGALLTGSLIALIAGRTTSSTAHAGWLGCGVAGAGVSCSGRF